MNRNLLLPVLLAAGLLSALSGCGRESSTQPASSPTAGTVPQFLVDTTGGPAAAPSSGPVRAKDDMSGTGFASALITARWGGVVRYDRYTVFIPAGALPQDTVITVRRGDQGYVMCELEPHGIQFLKPVVLRMDLTGIDYAPYTDWTIFWLNRDSGVWEDQHAMFWNGVLWVRLFHFSDYAAGRGGW